MGIEEDEAKVLRVKADSNVQALAGAIAHALYANHNVTVRAIGAGAVNQMAKAVGAARAHVAPRGYDLIIKPGFQEVESRDGTITAVIFNVSI